MNKIKVSIFGATGYTGLELIRLLISNENVDILNLHSTTNACNISELYPHLKDILDNKLTDKSPVKIANESDIVFMALPHGESIKYINQIIGKTKIIDLSADLRLDKVLHEKFYPSVEFNKDIYSQFKYGFIEKYKEKIKASHNISNPGCFALCSQLSLLPFEGSIESSKIFAISGSSGGGKKLSEGAHHPIRSHNLFSYNMNTHRHIGEMIQSFNDINLSFVPSSGPFVRGIFVNNFITLKNETSINNLDEIIHNNAFIRKQTKVEIANIIGSNYCDISINYIDNKNVIVQAALDNLIKGAAGNAIQCMNIMFDLPEKSGLTFSPIYP